MANIVKLALRKNVVSDGILTRDPWSHNPELYRLSYAHHIFMFLNYKRPIVAEFNLSLSLCKENANYLITRRWLRSRGVFDRDSGVGLSLVFRGFSFFSGLDAGLSTISLTI